MTGLFLIYLLLMLLLIGSMAIHYREIENKEKSSEKHKEQVKALIDLRRCEISN